MSGTDISYEKKERILQFENKTVKKNQTMIWKKLPFLGSYQAMH